MPGDLSPRSRPIGALLCGAVLWAGIAAAETPDCPIPPEPPDKALLDELVGWIALHTMYDASRTYRDPPEIVFCEIGDTVDYEGREIIVEPELHAAYDLPARRIHLVLPWSADDPFHVSVLLHELIHDVQLMNRDWACIGEPEWEAYRLQDLWLWEHGVEYDFNWTAIYLMSRCPSDVHP